MDEICDICGELGHTGCTDNARKPLLAEITQLRSDLQVAREALEFYANQQNWRSGEQVNYDEHFDTPMAKVNDNHGATAREALQRLQHGEG